MQKNSILLVIISFILLTYINEYSLSKKLIYELKFYNINSLKGILISSKISNNGSLYLIKILELKDKNNITLKKKGYVNIYSTDRQILFRGDIIDFKPIFINYELDFKNEFFIFANITDIHKSKSLKNKIQYTISKRIDYFPEFISSFMYTLIFGKAIINYEIKNSITFLGLLYIFALSGLHINIFIDFIKRIRMKSKAIFYFIIIFCFIYMSVVDFIPSLSRACIQTMINSTLILNNIKHNRLKILCYTFFIQILVFGYICIDIGFTLSYLSMLAIYFCDFLFKRIIHSKLHLLKKIATNFMCIIFTIPVLIYIHAFNFKIFIGSLFVDYFLIFIVSMIWIFIFGIGFVFIIELFSPNYISSFIYIYSSLTKYILDIFIKSLVILNKLLNIN